jgi:streptogramin lyase
MPHLRRGRTLAAAAAIGAIILLAANPAAAQQFVVSHFAGSRVGGPGYADGPVSTAQIAYPYHIAVDPVGNIYVAEAGHNLIRKVTPGGLVSTLAGQLGVMGIADGAGQAAQFNFPVGIVVDSSGNLFVTDENNHTIRKITPIGEVTTVAGLAMNSGTTDGTGSAARFRGPWGLAIDGSDNIYIADSLNNKIRKMTPAGVVTTLAGSPTGLSGYADGVGTAATFNRPHGIVSDAAGNLYVCDYNNVSIRRIEAGTGAVTTLAGQHGQVGTVDGVGTAARFNGPEGIAFDGSGNLYVTESAGQTVRRIAPDATVATVAGLGGTAGWVDGTGSSVRFSQPTGIAFGTGGAFYVSEYSNHSIRVVTPGGVVTTLLGRAAETGTTDGPASLARFRFPAGMAVDSSGNAFVADRDNCTIRKITPSGVVSTFAGTPGACAGGDGTGSGARFWGPLGVAIDSSDNLFVADYYSNTIRRVTPAAVVTTVAGAVGQAGSTDGPASLARFRGPRGIVCTSDGTLYVVETTNDTVRAIDPGGNVTTLAGLALQAGSADGTGTDARFNAPRDIALGRDGYLYVADTNNHTIRRIWPASGVVTTFAGQAGVAGSHDDQATSEARFYYPYSLAVDAAGVIYVADWGNNMIRRIGTDLNVRKIAGPPGPIIYGQTDGAAPQARFAGPYFITYDPIRNSLLVSDVWNQAIRRLEHVQTRDIDEDGKTDLAVYRSSSGTWFVTTSVSNFQEWGYVGWGIEAMGDVPAPGDYNGDGIVDPGVFRPSTGTWFLLTNADHGEWSWFGWGDATDTLVQGDYDGDGATDGAVYRPSSGTWYIRPSSGATPWNVVFGEASDIPVPADYDGDGKLDIAVYRPASGTWFILTSMSHYTSWYYRGWGIQAEGDTPVQGGDFDGDGKADLCVFRPASGTWFILESHADYTTWNWFGWGVTGDVLVPADYDGDGVTDAAVYRPVNGTWYARLSRGGSPLIEEFGAAGDVPAWKVR